ncbi:hypothetical protein [Nocardioides xinjiangensis]|uniref:hypothetical protein n=1 Tax=Nocardioides xinjiangensis TaxID=2817376 RepID=UPI001B317122|nr:hypothetical protein [Nocardioides sp. SYSU D00778]
MRLLEVTITWLRVALARWTGPGRPPVVAGPAPLGAGRRVVVAGLVQPDRTSCGSACLVVARMLGDPSYARWLATGEAGGSRRDVRAPERRFADEALAAHARTSHWADADGHLQVPWPRRYGTAPWSLARELSLIGGTTPPGTRHRVRTISPRRRGEAFDEVAVSVGTGHAVPLFVGNRLLPRHVVLVVGASADRLTAYDPATGRRVVLPRDAFVTGTLRVSGWSEPWFAVLPEPPQADG